MAPGTPASGTHRRRWHVGAHAQVGADLRRDEVLLSESEGNRRVLHDVLLAHVLKVACPGAQLHAATVLLLLRPHSLDATGHSCLERQCVTTPTHLTSFAADTTWYAARFPTEVRGPGRRSVATIAGRGRSLGRIREAGHRQV